MAYLRYMWLGHNGSGWTDLLHLCHTTLHAVPAAPAWRSAWSTTTAAAQVGVMLSHQLRHAPRLVTVKYTFDRNEKGTLEGQGLKRESLDIERDAKEEILFL